MVEETDISKLSVLGMIVSTASIAVAVVAVLVMLTCVAFSSRPVTVVSTGATRTWFLNTVVSESHFALFAIAFGVVIVGTVGFGGFLWLEATELRYGSLIAIRHHCRGCGMVR